MGKPYGYAKARRLTRRSEIERVFRQGRYHKLGSVQAKSLPAAAPYSRFMVSVRKSVGPAPARNRIKRVLREAIRLNRDLLQTPHDVCFFVTRRPAHPVHLSNIEPDIRQLFARLSRGKA